MLEACKLRNYIEKSINTHVACHNPHFKLVFLPFRPHIHIHSENKLRGFFFNPPPLSFFQEILLENLGVKYWMPPDPTQMTFPPFLAAGIQAVERLLP